MRVLVVNAGSSALRLTVIDADGRQLDHDAVPAVPGQVPLEPLQAFLEGQPARGAEAVGHRLVHGGLQFTGPALVDDLTLQRLRSLDGLAARCNAGPLGALAVARAALPALPHVASFDTAFHHTLPPAAATYPLPWEWTSRFGLRRFGFHGLSHQWAAERAAGLLGAPLPALRVVTAHLGATSSLAAVEGGASVDTTMGVTPLDGLVMATRSGTVDPSAILAVQQVTGMRAEDVEDALMRRSGLLGLSGLSGDLRDIEAAARAGFDRARLAIDVAAHRLRGGVAAMAAAMGGLDALVFTGGIGESDAPMRARVVDRLGFLGADLDELANERRGADDRLVSTRTSRVAVAVVRSREDLVIAREARAVVEQVGSR